MNNNNYCMIMAGGVGSRFWPLSKNDKPKQFLDILGVGKTLLQQTFERFTPICPAENIMVITNENYKELVLEQLPDIKPENILLEPFRRNTAPCIAYANNKLLSINEDANIIVSPADHLIINEQKFNNTLEKALSFSRTNDALLTLGIKPSRIETGYGYIQINNKDNRALKDLGIRKVKTFTEKPNYEMAKIFFESGEFFWNSGIFIWSLKSINKAFDNHLPDVNDKFKNQFEVFSTPEEQTVVNKVYAECRNISLDYGIMEKAENVHVLCADFGWSDLGTWGSMFENSTKDANQNVIKANNTLCYETKNSIIDIPDGKIGVVQGLDGYIVVQTEDTLLICKKDEEQKIKQFVNDVKNKYDKSFI